jgi:RES domain-containing protein
LYKLPNKSKHNCPSKLTYIFTSGSLSKVKYQYLVAIDIPDRIWKTREIVEKETLPINWNICPPSKSSIDFGNAWIKSEKSVLMSLPSVIVPEDSIFLINPLHKDSSLINASVVRKWEYDIRLFS